MHLWRILALSAVCAVAHSPTAVAEDDNAESVGLFSFLTQELQRQSELVQRFFFDPQTTIVVVDDDGLFDLQDEEVDAGLTSQEQQLACMTALKIFHEQDELKQDRQQLSKRLRSPFKRAFQVLSLSYEDETSCDDLDDPRIVDEVLDAFVFVGRVVVRSSSNSVGIDLFSYQSSATVCWIWKMRSVSL